jgi:hypothetical protein
MRHLQKEKGRATTISIMAIALIVASTTTAMTITIPVQATTTTEAATLASNNNTTTAAAATPTPSSGIKLSPQPIYQERSPPGNVIPINQTHGILTLTGTGMLTLPNTTQTINTTYNGTAIISFATSSGYGKETIRTENGETVTATVYEIVQFNNPAAAPEGGGKGIVTAVFQTNSTGMLAPLNGVIAAGIDEMSPSEESHVTLWEWESGIPLSTNTTTTSTSTATSETDVTTTAGTTDGREEQQQQTTPTVPSTPLTAPY